jgi:surface polysaccharide O-acyltransferase-like enzyme
MRGWFLFGIAVAVLFIFILDWRLFKEAKKKEKAAFLALLGMAAALAVLLVYKPLFPGPTQLIDFIYKPIARMFGL